VNRVAAGHAGPPRDDRRSPRPPRGLDDERANSGEVRNADAVICLAEGNPAAALAAIQEVLDGTAPVVGYVTVVEAHLLAGLAHRVLGDQRAANQAAERALAPAEPDRLILPFAITGSRELLEAPPRHESAPRCSPASSTSCTLAVELQRDWARQDTVAAVIEIAAQWTNTSQRP
jgi:hypothetical protein